MLLILAVTIRILSNSWANVFQKKLTLCNYNAAFINFIMYLGLSICVIPLMLSLNYSNLSIAVWKYAVLGGLFGALGNSFLIKALNNGELSVLGPINAYKSVIAMIMGIFLLKEIPSLIGIAAVILIVIGSYFVFDTQEEGFSFRLLKRTDIRYRIYALIFTALEALCIKNVINGSDIVVSFIFWCVFGMLFTGLFSLRGINKQVVKSKQIWVYFIGIIILMGLMQLSTNYVFSKIQVSYGLALFQLSALVSVILGRKYFKETQIGKKLFGALIMVIGAVILTLIG